MKIIKSVPRFAQRIASFLGVLALAVVFGFTMAACEDINNGGEEGIDTDLAGKWYDSQENADANGETGLMFTLTADGAFTESGTYPYNNSGSHGTRFTTSSGKITTWDGNVAKASADYNLSGTALSLSNTSGWGVTSATYYKSVSPSTRDEDEEDEEEEEGIPGGLIAEWYADSTLAYLAFAIKVDGSLIFNAAEAAGLDLTITVSGNIITALYSGFAAGTAEYSLSADGQTLTLSDGTGYIAAVEGSYYKKASLSSGGIPVDLVAEWYADSALTTLALAIQGDGSLTAAGFETFDLTASVNGNTISALFAGTPVGSFDYAFGSGGNTLILSNGTGYLIGYENTYYKKGFIPAGLVGEWYNDSAFTTLAFGLLADGSMTAPGYEQLGLAISVDGNIMSFEANTTPLGTAEWELSADGQTLTFSNVTGYFGSFGFEGTYYKGDGNGGSPNTGNPSANIPSGLVAEWYTSNALTTVLFEISANGVLSIYGYDLPITVSGNTITSAGGTFDYSLSANGQELTISNGTGQLAQLAGTFYREDTSAGGDIVGIPGGLVAEWYADPTLAYLAFTIKADGTFVYSTFNLPMSISGNTITTQAGTFDYSLSADGQTLTLSNGTGAIAAAVGSYYKKANLSTGGVPVDLVATWGGTGVSIEIKADGTFSVMGFNLTLAASGNTITVSSSSAVQGTFDYSFTDGGNTLVLSNGTGQLVSVAGAYAKQ